MGRSTRIAFGSCSKTTLPQPLWDVLTEFSANGEASGAHPFPEAFIWAGDAVYADKRRTSVSWVGQKSFVPTTESNLKAQYALQVQHAGYANFLKELTEKRNGSLAGVWDDHDYGINDGDKNFILKEKSKSAFLDFIGESLSSVRRTRIGGLYDSMLLANGKIRIILLDVRYSRSSWDECRSAHPDTCTMSMLGPLQWKWFEDLIASPPTPKLKLNIVISGMTALQNRHYIFGGRIRVGEAWGGMPSEQNRLFSLLANATSPSMILSGDIHTAEISSVDCVAGSRDAGRIYEFTSSGMTHSWLQQMHLSHGGRFISNIMWRFYQSIFPQPYQHKWFGER